MCSWSVRVKEDTPLRGSQTSVATPYVRSGTEVVPYPLPPRWPRTATDLPDVFSDV